MRYSVFPCSSVKSSMSLHKNRRSLRPLFALFRSPSLSSFRSPKYRVGAVRSSRLWSTAAVRTICMGRGSDTTYPWPSQRCCVSSLRRSRPSCSRIDSLMSPRMRSAVRSARSVFVRSSSGSVYCMICFMSNGYRVMRCTVKEVGVDVGKWIFKTY
jgi:hypothetical protein